MDALSGVTRGKSDEGGLYAIKCLSKLLGKELLPQTVLMYVESLAISGAKVQKGKG